MYYSLRKIAICCCIFLHRIIRKMENNNSNNNNRPSFARENVDEEVSIASCMYCLCDPCMLNEGVPDMGLDDPIGEDIALAIPYFFEGVEELDNSTLEELRNVLKGSYKRILTDYGYSDDWIPLCVERKINLEIAMFVASNYTNGIRN